MEFDHGLSAAPNYGRLQNKLDMLNELSKEKFLLDSEEKDFILRQFKTKFEDVINNPSIKEKYFALKAEVEGSGVSSGSDLDDELKEKIMKFKNKIESRLANALKSVVLDVEAVKAKARDCQFESKIEELNKDINKEFETVLNSSDDLKSQIEQLKIEVAMAGNTPHLASKSRIAAMEQLIKKSLAEAIDNSSLKEKYENLTPNVSSKGEFSGGSNGSLKSKDPSGNDEFGVEVVQTTPFLNRSYDMVLTLDDYMNGIVETASVSS